MKVVCNENGENYEGTDDDYLNPSSLLETCQAMNTIKRYIVIRLL